MWAQFRTWGSLISFVIWNYSITCTNTSKYHYLCKGSNIYDQTPQ